MNDKSESVEVLRQRMHAFISYGVYLKLIKRCGVVFVPVYGWVA